jgi:hypothetical protein
MHKERIAFVNKFVRLGGDQALSYILISGARGFECVRYYCFAQC